MRVLNARQFAEYAARQIAAAEEILARHGRAGAGRCRCEREWPCPVAASCAAMREHYRARLAVAEATVRLPVVAAAGLPSGPSPRWPVAWLRRVLRRVWRREDR